MNYIFELNAFGRWTETNHLSTNAQLLWYKLIDVFNKCGWQEWITVDNFRLMSFISITNQKTLVKAREELVEAKLINYIKGTKGNPGKYKLISFEKRTDNVSNSSTNMPTKTPIETPIEMTTDMTIETPIEMTTDMTIETPIDVTTIYKQNINKTKLNKIEKESKEKEYSVTAVEDTSKIVSSNNLLHLVPYDGIVELYNSICVSLNPVVKLTDKRKQSIGARYREYGCNIEIFKTLFEKVQSSSFLVGNNQKGWQADFDWLMKPNNFVKVMEDKYKPKLQEKEQKEKGKEEEEIKSGKYGIHL